MTPKTYTEEVARPVRIVIDDIFLNGDLQLPEQAVGLVIFVHGSGSSRFSPRNRFVARELNHHGLATLLLDLLTEEEQRIDDNTMALRFDIPILGTRSTQVVNWCLGQSDLKKLPIGLFGASTGAAAALITAAAVVDDVQAVVSRGGRPDLAERALDKVEAPTLLIVGGNDDVVIDLNEQAIQRMHCEKKLHIVPNATHLFEEPGTLEEVTKAATDWFLKHLQGRKAGVQQGAVLPL